MFPTIFALGIRGLGPLTKKAASFLVMAVAGGAFCPPVMGAIADHFGMSVAFIFVADECEKVSTCISLMYNLVCYDK
jgi:fucose permease